MALAAVAIALGLCSCAAGEVRSGDDDDNGPDSDADGGDACPYYCASTTTCNDMSGVVHDGYECDFPLGGVCCDW